MPGPGHHPLTVVSRHLHLGIMGRQCGHGLLDVDEAEFALLAADRNEHRGAKQAERAAALHPIRGVHHLDLGIVCPRLQHRDKPTAGIRGKQGHDRFAFLIGQRPKRAAQRNGGGGVFDPLAGQILPLPPGRSLHRHLDHLRPFLIDVGGGTKTLLVALDELFHHPGCRHARQVGASRGTGHR